jgi:hypothetical protein
LADEGAKQLPKYDWPESLVYQTPSAHRVMTKRAGNIADDVSTLASSDEHFVVVRPKAIVDSSGTTCASEVVRLRFDYPESFEITTTGSEYSTAERSYVARVQYTVYQYLDMCMEEDIEKITDDRMCPHRAYEIQRLDHLLARVDAGHNVGNAPDAIADMQVMIPQLKGGAEEMKVKLAEANPVSYDDFTTLTDICSSILGNIKRLQLPNLRPRVAHFTDAGPGVGVSNVAVKFRDAELARLEKSDYRVRVHRARGDSGQNEAERTNSASGDAIVDGKTIEWEYHKKFEGMTSDERAAMSINEFDVYEARRMARNAWHVSEDLANRLDGAPVLSSYIHGLVSCKPEEQFFFNKNELRAYIASSASTRKDLPGGAYITKIYDFMDHHYVYGELYMEFLKGKCEGQNGTLCTYCSSTGWIGPVMDGVPASMPDYDKLPSFHYKSVDTTSCHNEDGDIREVDGFMPRAQLRKAFKAGELLPDNTDASKRFCEKYVVKKQYVTEYLSHLQELQWLKKMRSSTKQALSAEKKKSVHDYDWKQILESGSLGKLTVMELTKYLDHFNLPNRGKKADKVRTIAMHIASDVPVITVETDEETDDEHGQEEVLATIANENDISSHSEDEALSSSSDVSDGDLDSLSDQENSYSNMRYPVMSQMTM